MRIITSFGESDHKQVEDEGLEEYGQIFQALVHSLEVAENVFARVAKKAFKRRVGDARFREAKDARGMIPTWTTESSVVLIRPPPRDHENWLHALDDLVEGVSWHLMYSVRERPFVLVDPLSVRIQHVGEDLFRFVIKQKWALEKQDG
jgi:hypothetical protein